jgi:ribosomal protein L7Ae-like RNA K-turn-binding protein
LGLALRAGKLALGASAVEERVIRGRRPLVILARGAGESQRRHLLRLAPVRGFVVDVVGREDLARRLGRRELSVAAVDDPDFVAGIERLGIEIVKSVRGADAEGR